MSMRKILALLLAIAMICSLCVSPALAAEDAGEPVVISDNEGPLFTDIEGHWSESAINRWASYGIIQGDGDGTVRPNRTLKRDELATILARLLGLKEKAPAGTFKDVPANAWYADAVLKCAAAGIMLGDGAGRANPESPIDRQQAIVMVARALGAKASNSKSLSAFKDGNTVADWAAPYLASLTDMGILNGLPDGDGFVVAPEDNINRAGLFALLDKAIGQYVVTPATVTVNDPNKFVVINTDAGEDVTVTGKTAGIVVGAGSTDDVILDNATVGTLKVDAPVDIIIKKGSAVTDLEANAAAKVENNGTVTNLNTNADDVTFDGNKPAAVNTAEDVEPAKDSKGNEVTTAPTPSTSSGSSSGSNRPSHKYDLTVKVEKTEGGTVTIVDGGQQDADADGNFKPITVVATPDVQEGNKLPYKVDQIVVFTAVEDATVEFETSKEGPVYTYTITPTKAAEYTVHVDFVQPITKAVMYVANGTDKTAADMEADGYTPVGDVTDDILAQYPYFFIGLTKGTHPNAVNYQIHDFKLTANGKNVPLPWGSMEYTNIFKFASAYVGSNQPEIDPHTADKLNLDGSAYTFVLTFKVNDDVEYKFECDYIAPNANPEDLKTVTFKTSTGKVLATYKGTAEETVTVPTHPELDGYYFTGWDKDATDGAEDYTIGEGGEVTANYFEVTTQTTATRPVGDPDNFDYPAKYTALGLALKNDVLTVDAKTLISAETVADELVKTENGADYIFYGVEYTKPADAADATHAVVSYGKTLTEFDDANKVAVGETDSSDGGTSAYNGHLIDYLPVAYRAEGVWNFFKDGATFTRYIKWMKDDEILSITKAVITLKVVPATYTVTFKDGSKTVSTVKVDYNSAEWELAAAPEKAGNIFLGWLDSEGNEVTEPSILTADLTLTAKWAPIANVTDVEVIIDGVGTKLGVTATEYKNGAITYTVDEADFKAAWEDLSDSEKTQLEHEGRLFVRVNFAVPADVDESWTFVGSTDNGEHWRGEVNPFNEENLGAVGLNVTKDATGKITHLGQWFGIATVTTKDGVTTFSFPDSTSWTILYKWTDNAGNVKFTTFELTREVNPAPVVTPPEETNEGDDETTPTTTPEGTDETEQTPEQGTDENTDTTTDET